MRRFWMWGLLLVLAASLGSCRKAVEKARRNIRVEAVEGVRLQGLTGAELAVKLTNDTGHKLVLKEMTLDVNYGESCAVTAVLKERVEVEPHWAGTVKSHWQLKIANPMTLYALTKRVMRHDLSKVTVSFQLKGRGGPVPVNISQEKVELSRFLNTFGVNIDDILNYIK